MRWMDVFVLVKVNTQCRICAIHTQNVMIIALGSELHTSEWQKPVGVLCTQPSACVKIGS